MSASELDALADRVWGPGNWTACPDCPDGEGNPSRHSTIFHDTHPVETALSLEAILTAEVERLRAREALLTGALILTGRDVSWDGTTLRLNPWQPAKKGEDR